MPQQFQVLKCFQCQMFQVQMVKKTPKWTCKVCEAKQSLIEDYGVGTSSECRVQVQKLNCLRGMSESQVTDNESHSSEVPAAPPLNRETGSTSKWQKYLDEDDEENQDN